MTLQKILPQAIELKLVHYSNSSLIHVYYRIGMLWFPATYSYAYLRRYFKRNYIAIPLYKISDSFYCRYNRNIELGWGLEEHDTIVPQNACNELTHSVML